MLPSGPTSMPLQGRCRKERFGQLRFGVMCRSQIVPGISKVVIMTTDILQHSVRNLSKIYKTEVHIHRPPPISSHTQTYFCLFIVSLTNHNEEGDKMRRSCGRQNSATATVVTPVGLSCKCVSASDTHVVATNVAMSYANCFISCDRNLTQRQCTKLRSFSWTAQN